MLLKEIQEGGGAGGVEEGWRRGGGGVEEGWRRGGRARGLESCGGDVGWAWVEKL